MAEMVLCGSVNKKIALGICSWGGRAIGLSGRDDGLMGCVKLDNLLGFGLGFLGAVREVNTDLLKFAPEYRNMSRCIVF